MPTASNQSWLQRLLVFVVCVTVLAGYAWSATNIYRAHRAADHPNISSFEKAVALAPQNATYHDLLCRSVLFTLGNVERAVAECTKASQLNPYSSTHWLDLAQAQYAAGNRVLTLSAAQKALTVDPTTPDTSWNVANFFLTGNDNALALKQFAIVLREDPALAPAVLNICWQTLHNLKSIEEILPPNPSVYLSFIRLLSASQENAEAHQIWNALIQLHLSINERDAFFYIDSLLDAHDAPQAKEAWEQLQSRSSALQAYSEPNNLATDGHFSRDVLNAGFAWRYTARPEHTVLLDNADFHSAPRSLSITYNGSGGDAGIFQYIAVQPKARYRISAWVKSEDIATANGPMIALLAAYSDDVVASTEPCIGSTDWHQVSTEVQIPDDVYLARIAVVRRPAYTQIKGRLWLDDVEVSPATTLQTFTDVNALKEKAF